MKSIFKEVDLYRFLNSEDFYEFELKIVNDKTKTFEQSYNLKKIYIKEIESYFILESDIPIDESKLLTQINNEEVDYLFLYSKDKKLLLLSNHFSRKTNNLSFSTQEFRTVDILFENEAYEGIISQMEKSINLKKEQLKLYYKKDFTIEELLGDKGFLKRDIYEALVKGEPLNPALTVYRLAVNPSFSEIYSFIQEPSSAANSLVESYIESNKERVKKQVFQLLSLEENMKEFLRKDRDKLHRCQKVYQLLTQQLSGAKQIWIYTHLGKKLKLTNHSRIQTSKLFIGDVDVIEIDEIEKIGYQREIYQLV